MFNQAGIGEVTLNGLVPPNLPVWKIVDRETLGQPIRIIAVGDIGLSGMIGKRIAGSPEWNPLREVTSLLKTGDIVFGNLETPFLNDWTSESILASSKAGALRLKKSGFTILHLANNHIYDYGLQGIEDTLDASRAVGLLPLGIGATCDTARNLVGIDINGLRVGLLGCGYTGENQVQDGFCFWEFNRLELLESVSSSSDEVDLLIVSIHIGKMYLDYPHPKHKEFAEELTKAGADLVLMHHAHVLQGVESIQENSVVCYNLGNFLFDWTDGYVKVKLMEKERREGAIFWFEVDKDGICKAVVLPTYMDDNFDLRWAIDTRGETILSRLKKISDEMSGNYLAQYYLQRIRRNHLISLKVIWFHFRNRNWGILKNYLGGILSRLAGSS